jgi:hypothetical protein
MLPSSRRFAGFLGVSEVTPRTAAISFLLPGQFTRNLGQHPELLAGHCLEGFDGFVTSAAAP